MYERFEELLKSRGITVYQFCKETGIRPSTIYNWKARGGNLRVNTLMKIAQYFGVSVDCLIGKAVTDPLPIDWPE